LAAATLSITHDIAGAGKIANRIDMRFRGGLRGGGIIRSGAVKRAVALSAAPARRLSA
jgi:hypothetical protein|tara:strand:- start:122 stop:295 length:174 start_codon:yes stop_codon:yes gene_type:complete